MQLAGVVILYHPTEEVITHIQSYVNDVDVLYVFDNSSVKNESITKSFANDYVQYFFDGENRGIAERLNKAVEIASAAGFDWLLTMDQDSFFEEGMIPKYKQLVEQYNEQQKTAVFGVTYESSVVNNKTYKHVPLLITSGSILNLKLFYSIGKFDEQLFIDEVDSEYCYRARIKGYNVIECTSVYLHHHLGEMQMGRSLKSGKLTPRRLHAPIRLYYMVRNYFYVLSKLPQIAEAEKKEMTRGLFVRIKNNLIYNKQRWQVIKFIVKGYNDYKKQKMGKISF